MQLRLPVGPSATAAYFTNYKCYRFYIWNSFNYCLSNLIANETLFLFCLVQGPNLGVEISKGLLVKVSII